MTARAQKVEVIVIGSGFGAHALAYLLTRKGRRVGLLAERDSPLVTLPDFPLWQPAGPRLEAALRGWALLGDEDAGLRSLPAVPLTARLRHESGAESTDYQERLAVAGDSTAVAGGSNEATRLAGCVFDVGACLSQLREAIEAGGGLLEVGGRVRGVSVIEGEVLGVIAEGGRWDSRVVVNAADDERAMAIGRMVREPLDLSFASDPLLSCDQPVGEAVVTLNGAARWNSATGSYFLGDSPLLEFRAPCRSMALVTRSTTTQPLVCGQSARVHGSWRLLGVAGWPLAAFGAAAGLVDQMEADR